MNPQGCGGGYINAPPGMSEETDFFVIVGIIFAIKRGDSKQASRNKEFRLAVVRTVRNADSHTGVCSCNSPIADPPLDIIDPGLL